MNQVVKPEKASEELVEKYLRRIQRKRKLKEQTKLTGAEVFQIYDATRIVYLLMPSTRVDLEIKNTELVYDYEVPLETEEDINPVEKTILNLKENGYEELSAKDAVEKENVRLGFENFEYAPFDKDLQTVCIYRDMISPWEFSNKQSVLILESEEDGRVINTFSIFKNEQIQNQLLDNIVIEESIAIEESTDGEMKKDDYRGGTRSV